MREEYWHHAFWLLVIGSWVLGIAYGRWGGGGGFFLDLSQAVSVPYPQGMWWQPLVYFVLTVIAAFVLSQLFFGAGAAIFLFSRGVYDSMLLGNLQLIVGGWTFPDIPPNQLWAVFFIVLILAVNLPLCLWAAHLGTQQATRMWYRLRGKPVKPGAGAEPLQTFLVILAASVVAGLIGSLAVSYT